MTQYFRTPANEDHVPKRPVIVHFHLFKNAGTSVDTILQHNFPTSWAEIEGPDGKKLDPDDLADYIRANPHLNAVSSHTAVVSVPSYEDIEILPIFFVRHPIDRIRSAYDFERKQDAQTPGAIKAKQGDFAHYMEWRLSTHAPWQVMNFHAARLKDFHTFTPMKQMELHQQRCFDAINALPVVGLVENFDQSMSRFQSVIQPHFPKFKIFSAVANPTAAPGTGLDANMAKFEERIGQLVYDKLCQINALDFELYEYVKGQFDS